MSYTQVVLKNFGGSEELEVRTVEDLPEPQPGEIRIRVLVTSAAFTYVMIRKGMYPDVKEKPPFVPGYDLVGVVDAPGPGVDEFALGDRVADLTIIGAYSEYVCPPAERLTRVPEGDGVDFVFDGLGGESFPRSMHALRPGGTLVAFGFQNKVLGRGGSIPLDFVKLKLWDWLPNGHATAFYSIGAMRRKYPDWFKHVALLDDGRIDPAVAHADTLLAGGRVLDRAALDAMETALLAAGSEAH